VVVTAERLAEQASVTDNSPRCWRCNKVLAVFLTRPWRVDCPRCHATNKRDPLAPDEPIT
jgi:ribosomal protein S27AE